MNLRINTKSEIYELRDDVLTIKLLETGDIQEISYKDKYINQLRGNRLEGMPGNVYLRVATESGYRFTKLIGDRNDCRITYGHSSVIYKGSFLGIEYNLTISVVRNAWFIEVKLANLEPIKPGVDLFYAQDIGINHRNAILGNESYNSQYIDHKVYSDITGYKICSLQNQGNHEYLQVGSFGKTVGFATDGYQFYGLDYKITNIPVAMTLANLPNEVYQYEFAMATLKTETFRLNQTHETVFYGYYVDHHEGYLEGLEFTSQIMKLYKSIANEERKRLIKSSRELDLDNVLASLPMDTKEIDGIFTAMQHVEAKDTKTLSFFTPEHTHVVMMEKERLVERAHGHIIVSATENLVDEENLTSTSYVFGLFNSQIALGNTTFHKLLSNSRNGLNVMKSSGQRIFIKQEGKWRLLTMPAIYEIGFNQSRWLYKLPDDIIDIRSFITYSEHEIILDIVSTMGKQYEILITNQIVMGNEEYASAYELNLTDTGCQLTLAPESFVYSHAPKLNFRIDCEAETHKIFSESKLFGKNNPGGATLCFHAKGCNVRLLISGAINQDAAIQKNIDFLDEKRQYDHFYSENTARFHVSLPKDNPEKEAMDSLNQLIPWYSHDALIHYLSPHGLEQYGGAAWGTRDLCQGPFEHYLAFGNFKVAKQIIIDVFRHQYQETGTWPQWFMFDRYYRIQHHESHGDVIVWPLMALGKYLRASNDFSILNQKICYTSIKNYEYTECQELLSMHVKKQIDSIMTNVMKGTALSLYGGGDWDDTLQPANQTLKEKMVSGWTTALTYEAFKIYSEAISAVDESFAKIMDDFAEAIKQDYHQYVIKDGIPAGFIYFGDQSLKYIIHPLDTDTKMKYRLLPMNRCIISGLVTKEEAMQYRNLIREHLSFPDGVRLMNRTVEYRGGKNSYFTRAETAANFGREIGLQYVHAHIRYLEALANLDEREDLWKGIMTINPINLTKSVPNALTRQSNAYFSSSDGAFLNRYEAMAHFEDLHSGKAKVKGGWRIYSSGPGIMINTLIKGFFGISRHKGDLLVGPTLPDRFDGLELTMNIVGKKFRIVYHLGKQYKKISRVQLNGKSIFIETVPNKYKQGDLLIRSELIKDLNNDENLLELYYI